MANSHECATKKDQAFAYAFSKKENHTTKIAEGNMPKIGSKSVGLSKSKHQVVGSSEIRVLSDNLLPSDHGKLKEDIQKILSGSLRQPLFLCPPKEEGLVEFFSERGYEVADDTADDDVGKDCLETELIKNDQKTINFEEAFSEI